MSQSVSQKEYLRKYLSGGASNTKKKKKKKVIGQGIKIIDDDVDISKIKPIDENEIDLYGDPEDAPQIAGIIDERPEEMKFNSHRWKIVNQDDGLDSTMTVHEISKKEKNPHSTDETSINSDSNLSLTRNNKTNDSDLSPERPSKRDKSDSDLSPNRIKNRKRLKKEQSDSDLSPPRKSKVLPKNKDKNINSGLSSDKNGKKHKSCDSDSDLSPVRNINRKGRSPERNSSKIHNKSHYSPSKKRKSREKDQISSKHKGQIKKDDFDISPARRQDRVKSNKHDSDSDLSPVRNERKYSPQENRNKLHEKRYSPAKKYNSDRKSRWDKNDSRQNDLYRRGKDDYNREYHRNRDRGDVRRDDRDSRKNYDSNNSRNNRRDNYEYKDDTSKKSDRTLEGKKSGLQNAQQLKDETDVIKQKEDEMFNKLSDEYTGRHAQAIKRDMRLGKQKDTEAERKEQEEREAKQKEMEIKYSRWGRGLKQTEEQEARIKDFLHESSKPLARYRDDRDLDEELKNRERLEDPMLEYFRRKGKDGNEVSELEVRPMYKGAYPLNRFDIRPGHRWDGVDRSNGYEKNYFKVQSDKRAREEETYKWSTEDM